MLASLLGMVMSVAAVAAPWPDAELQGTVAQVVAEAKTAPRASKVGLLLMAHGGAPDWNAAVEAAVRPLAGAATVEIAFGMAAAATMQAAATRLEAKGVNRIAVVRLFISGESFLERTEQILGLRPGAPPRPPHGGHPGHGQGHGMEFWRIDSQAEFALSRGSHGTGADAEPRPEPRVGPDPGARSRG